MKINKFFIVGCPRSGTTVLQQALNRHSQVVVPAESKYFYYSYGMPLRWQRRHAIRMESDLGVQLPTLPKAIRDDESHRIFFDDIALQCVCADDEVRKSEEKSQNVSEPPSADRIRWFGDKTPEHTTRIDDLRRVYPGCPIIFIYRDPRDVVLSLRDVPWVNCGIGAGATVWKRFARIAADIENDVAEGVESKVLFIRYEDLVSNPEPTLKTVCSFLSLPFESCVAYGAGDKRIIPDRELAWKSRSLQPLSNNRVNRWKRELSDTEVSQIESIAGPLMQRLGYEPQTEPPYRIGISGRASLAWDLIKMFRSLTYQCVLSEALSAWRSLIKRGTSEPFVDQSSILPADHEQQELRIDQLESDRASKEKSPSKMCPMFTSSSADRSLD